MTELAAMPSKEQERYEHDLHGYWTYMATIEKAMQDGLALGKFKGKTQGIKLGKAEGIKIGRAEGIDIGKAEGMNVGKAEQALEIARNMKQKGLDPAMIAEFTGLSSKEVNRLK